MGDKKALGGGIKLKKKTLRVLSTTDLDAVNGGGLSDGFGCTWTCSCQSCQGTDCETGNDTGMANNDGGDGGNQQVADGGWGGDGGGDGGFDGGDSFG